MSRRDSRTDGSGTGSVPVVQVVGFHVEGAAPQSQPVNEGVRETPTVLIPPALLNADQVTETPMRRSSNQVTPTAGMGSGSGVFASAASGDLNALSKTPSMSDAWRRGPGTEPGQLSAQADLENSMRRMTPRASPRTSPGSSHLLAGEYLADAPVSSSSSPMLPHKATLPSSVSTTHSPSTRSPYQSQQLPADVAAAWEAGMPAQPPIQRSVTMPTSPASEQHPVPTHLSGPAASFSGAEAPPKEQAKKPKEMTKAERRALQEAQRAKKAAAAAAAAGEAGGGASTGGGGDGKAAAKGGKPPAKEGRAKVSDSGAEAGKASASKASAASTAHRPVDMFSHLPAFKHMDVDKALTKQEKIHAAVLQLGLAYADRSLRGSTARTIAMMIALKAAIADYVTPDAKAFSRAATSYINLCVAFLWDECRPGCVPQRNSVKWLKNALMKLPHNLSEAEAKASILKSIDDFIHEKFVIADKVLSAAAVSKIEDGDVIMTYAHSSVVLNILLLAHQEGKSFEVICVDGRPHYEGEAMCRKLLSAGIKCTYVHLNAISYAMKPVTKVLLGASAVKSNGAVVARSGTAVVAMAASAEQKPVLICAQSIKFHEDVQLDSLTSNEQGDPQAMLTVRDREDITQQLAGMKKDDKLALLNLVYDVMPMSFITLIVTEFGLIPPTSVPVILREKRDEDMA